MSGGLSINNKCHHWWTRSGALTWRLTCCMRLNERKAMISKAENCAFSLLELLISVVLLCILACLIFMARQPAKAIRSDISCRNKLMQIGIAFHNVADNLGGTLPMQMSTNRGGTSGLSASYRHFQIIYNYLGPVHYLVCPNDSRKPAVTWETLINSSRPHYCWISAVRHAVVLKTEFKIKRWSSDALAWPRSQRPSLNLETPSF